MLDMQIKIYLCRKKNATKEDMSWKSESRLIRSDAWASFSTILSEAPVGFCGQPFLWGAVPVRRLGRQIKDI